MRVFIYEKKNKCKSAELIPQFVCFIMQYGKMQPHRNGQSLRVIDGHLLRVIDDHSLRVIDCYKSHFDDFLPIEFI